MHIHRYIIRPAPPPGMDFFLARNTHNLFHQDENSLHTEAGSTQKEASKFLGLASVFFFFLQLLFTGWHNMHWRRELKNAVTENTIHLSAVPLTSRERVWNGGYR